MKEYQHYNKSFTLIEILVVVAIVGILSGFIFYTVQNNVSKANIAKSQVFSESIRNNLLLNLVSEWKLDNNANDAWGTNNGTWYGSGGGTITSETYLSSSQCISGQCMEFDGTDDYIDCGTESSIQLETNFSVSFWMKRTATTNNVLGKWKGDNSTGWGVRIYSNKIYTGFRNGPNANYWGGYGETEIEQDKWYFIYFAYKGDGSLPGVYVNENQETMTTNIVAGDGGLSGINDSGEGFTIGRSHIFSGTTYYYFDGVVDDVKIYNSTMSSREINKMYVSELNDLFSQGLISESEYNERIANL